MNPRITESVGRLKSLKTLILYSCSYGIVADLVKKLPALENSGINMCKHISLNGIKRILEQTTSLKSLRVHDMDMLIDSDSSINSILELARNRAGVEISVNVNNVHISVEPYIQSILQPDTDWFSITINE